MMTIQKGIFSELRSLSNSVGQSGTLKKVQFWFRVIFFEAIELGPSLGNQHWSLPAQPGDLLHLHRAVLGVDVAHLEPCVQDGRLLRLGLLEDGADEALADVGSSWKKMAKRENVEFVFV